MNRFAKRLLKIALISSIFFAVIFTVMANLGGDNPVFKDGVERYITASTGYPAHIGKFNELRIFPNIIIDFENLSLTHPAGGDMPLGGAKKFRIKMNFFDVSFGRRKIRDLNIEELRLPAGALTPQELYVKGLEFGEPEEEGRITVIPITLIGTYGKNPMRITSHIRVKGTDKNRSFSFIKSREVSASFGDKNGVLLLKDGKIIFKDKTEIK